MCSAQIVGIQFVELSVFVFLVTKGIAARHHVPAHKRLMLLSTISLLGPAISRWPFAFIAGFPPSIALVTDVLLLSLFAFDWLTRRRIHRVTIYGSLLIFIMVPIAFGLSHLPVWRKRSGYNSKIAARESTREDHSSYPAEFQ